MKKDTSAHESLHATPESDSQSFNHLREPVTR